MNLSIEEIESILEVYSIEELLEMNDLTVADACEFLINRRFIQTLPDPQPLTTIQWDGTLDHDGSV